MEEEDTMMTTMNVATTKEKPSLDHVVSPSSSPPTPPSPLPVSVGPGNQKYLFSPSPSPSPPFSPRTSAEKLPLLEHDLPVPSTSTFSLDLSQQKQLQEADHKLDSSKSTCLTDLLEWFVARCCNCCSRLSQTSPLPI